MRRGRGKGNQARVGTKLGMIEDLGPKRQERNGREGQEKGNRDGHRGGEELVEAELVMVTTR